MKKQADLVKADLVTLMISNEKQKLK